MTIDNQDFHQIRLERKGIALHLTLNSPSNRNALSTEMVEEVMAVCEQLENDPGRCLVLRGAGKVFCSGGNIKQFAQDTRTEPPAEGPDPIEADNRHFGQLLQYLDKAPQVVVSVVEGSAYGGGCGLACASDIVIVQAEAKFALSETSIGVVPAQIAPFVVRRLGVVTARRLALTAARFDGAEAARIGLADILCENETAIEENLHKVLADIRRCAPKANSATKRFFGECSLKPGTVVPDEAAVIFTQALRAEGREGAAAFVEKRRPSWYERED